MDLMTWAWLIMTAILLVGEMLTAGFFLIVFAVGSFGSFLVAIFGGSVLWQWITFLVLSAIAFAGSRKFARRVHKGPTEFGVGAERYEGMKAYVIETIDVAAATGRIRVDREEWLAESVDGTTIQEGLWTEIVKVDGTRMVVSATSAPSEPSSEPEGSGTDE
jgi:membrane protein implicated in regulation of membrane protease activity